MHLHQQNYLCAKTCTFTLECHMFLESSGKQWKAVFFFTREFLPKSEIKIKILKKKCFFGGFHLPEVRKKGVEITIFIYLVFSVWPKI